jgi:hypothetical protein
MKLTVLAGTCPSAVVLPVHLPWLTTLLEPAVGLFVDDITQLGTNGVPGWLVECTVGIKIDDECVTEKGSPTQKNGAGANLEKVESIFENLLAEEEAVCSLNKEQSGMVEGTLVLEALSANGLNLEALDVSLGAEVI